MKKERLEQISKIFSNDNYTILGYHTDPQLQETTSVTHENIDPNSKEAKRLEAAGFKLIYPAELNSETLENYSQFDEDVFNTHLYEVQMAYPLIVDSNQAPTLDFAQHIISHYLLQDNIGGRIYGCDKVNNATSIDPKAAHFKEGSIENLIEVLNSFGFSASLDEFGLLNVHSDIPYPTVPKSKFQGMFEKTKGKLKDTFNKLKSFLKTKENEKDTEDPEL